MWELFGQWGNGVRFMCWMMMKGGGGGEGDAVVFEAKWVFSCGKERLQMLGGFAGSIIS